MSINPYAIPDNNDDDMDLFGDEEPTQGSGVPLARTASLTPDDDGVSDTERRKRRAMEYEEDDVPPPDIDLPREERDIALQNLGYPRSSDGNYWMLRLPNYLKVEPRPFNPDTYQPLGAEELNANTMTADLEAQIKMDLVNTIRWKWVRKPDGTMEKQSNARIVKWDDGTMSLQLGKEMYDISTTVDTATAASRSAESSQLFSQSGSFSQSLTESQTQTSSLRSQGPAFVVAQHRNEAILQVEATMTGTMNLRPIGTQSEIHRQLAKVVARKHSKVSKLRFASDSMLQQAEKDQEQQRKKGWKANAAKSVGDGTRKRRKQTATERRRKTGGYSDDEDNTEDEGADPSILAGRQQGADYIEDEFLVADSEDEGEAGTSRQSKRISRAEAEAPPDDLDEVERRIEENEKKRQTHDQGDAMDDDEDEEEVTNAVRKSYGKPKLAFIADSDEE